MADRKVILLHAIVSDYRFQFHEPLDLSKQRILYSALKEDHEEFCHLTSKKSLNCFFPHRIMQVSCRRKQEEREKKETTNPINNLIFLMFFSCKSTATTQLFSISFSFFVFTGRRNKTNKNYYIIRFLSLSFLTSHESFFVCVSEQRIQNHLFSSFFLFFFVFFPNLNFIKKIDDYY